MHRRISLIVTDDRPQALELLLASIARQTRTPHEVLVCGEGASGPTRMLVERWRDRLLCDLRYVWHARGDARLARARNLGIAAASGEYLVTVQGDVVLDADFVADHAVAARLGQWAQGVLAPLTASATNTLLSSGRLEGLGWRSGTGMAWRAVRMPWLARLALRNGAGSGRVAPCNQAYWRADLVRANGFDERFAGGRAEAREIAARLEHSGLERVFLRHCAIAWQLWSPVPPAAAREDDERLLAETVRTRATRAPVGLDVHGVAA